MRKEIVALSLCVATILNAGWYEDAKNKTTKAYEDSKNKVTETYDSGVKKYDDYNKENDKEKAERLKHCMVELEEKLPYYGMFLEQNYMDINRRSEAKILQNYKRLNSKGISSTLADFMDEVVINKLFASTSTIEYSNIVLTELKKIQKELKKNNKENLSTLIKQTKYLMYAWTAPMEILSTNKIYNSSLLGLSNDLYKNLNKTNYKSYTKFIYSMFYVNMINENIVVKKDTVFTAYVNTVWMLELPTSEDKKGLELVCKDVLSNFSDKSASDYLSENLASTLNIETEKIEKQIETISKNNNLFDGAVIFDKTIKDFKDINVVENPLDDNWYLMLREYMELQDNFYTMKKELSKIIKILAVLPETDSIRATLKEDMFDVDALYRKFDESVRYNIIDLPVSIYADLYQIEFRRGKNWYNDDEKAMGDIAVAYNKSCANMQKYMVSEFAVNKVMGMTRTLKKEFNDDEWKEVKTRAKLTQDWFNMLNKVKIQNK